MASFKHVSELDDPLHEYLRICQGDPSSLGCTPIDTKIGCLSVQTSSYTSTSMLFRKAMEDTILNVSPLVRHGLPYLETEAGRNAPVRRYLPEVLYFSQQLKHESPPRSSKYEEGGRSPERFQRLGMNERSIPENLHPFLRVCITPNMSKNQLLALLSDFRARGVRPRTSDKPVAAQVSVINDEWENIVVKQEQEYTDCLNPFNLQRLYVLFSSNCPNTPNAPHFCVSPWYFYFLLFANIKKKTTILLSIQFLGLLRWTFTGVTILRWVDSWSVTASTQIILVLQSLVRHQ